MKCRIGDTHRSAGLDVAFAIEHFKEIRMTLTILLEPFHECMAADTFGISHRRGHNSCRTAHIFDRKIANIDAFERRIVDVIAILDRHALADVDGSTAAFIIGPKEP